MPVITIREALQEALVEEMKKDETVFIMGEDIGIHGGAHGVTRGMLDELARRESAPPPYLKQASLGQPWEHP